MNKMNIPAPFRAALPTPPLPTSVPAPPPIPPPPMPPHPLVTDAGDSSNESEMESSDEVIYFMSIDLGTEGNAKIKEHFHSPPNISLETQVFSFNGSFPSLLPSQSLKPEAQGSLSVTRMYQPMCSRSLSNGLLRSWYIMVQLLVQLRISLYHIILKFQMNPASQMLEFYNYLMCLLYLPLLEKFIILEVISDELFYLSSIVQKWNKRKTMIHVTAAEGNS